MFGYYNEIVQGDMENILNRNINFERLRNKTVYITGANGMLASYIIYLLMYMNQTRGMGISILALARNKAKAQKRFGCFKDNPLFELLYGDVCDEITLKKNIDFIIHTAGNSSPKYILSDPVGIIKANTIGTMRVLDLARKNNIENLLFTSTREIYGKVECDVIREDDIGSMDCLDLRSCYPESKRMAENLITSYNYQYNIPFVITRIAHSYGPGMDIDNDGRVMADFISDTVSHKDIVLKSTGEVKRAFCYITDTISGIMIALLHGKSGQAYNIANETESVKIKDTAKMITELFPEYGINVKFEIPKDAGKGYSKMGTVRLDTTKLEKLGWSCIVDLREGLYRTVKSFE